MAPPPKPPEEWCMADVEGQRYRLPKTMLFMGRDECDIVLKVSSLPYYIVGTQ
jgi:hypothetical protein